MKKNIITALYSFVLTVLMSAGLAHAQNDIIIQEKVSVSRTLAGHVDIGLDKLPADSITVEICSPDWQTVLRSTKTDKRGHFAFDIPTSGELFYVRLSASGVNSYQLRVRIKRHGAKELNIHLSNAT